MIKFVYDTPVTSERACGAFASNAKLTAIANTRRYLDVKLAGGASEIVVVDGNSPMSTASWAEAEVRAIPIKRNARCKNCIGSGLSARFIRS